MRCQIGGDPRGFKKTRVHESHELYSPLLFLVTSCAGPDSANCRYNKPLDNRKRGSWFQQCVMMLQIGSGSQRSAVGFFGREDRLLRRTSRAVELFAQAMP